MPRCLALLAVCTLAACASAPQPPVTAADSGGWLEDESEHPDAVPADLRTGDPVADRSDLARYLQDVRTLASRERESYRRFLRKVQRRSTLPWTSAPFETVREMLRPAGDPEIVHRPYKKYDEWEYVLVRDQFSSGGVGLSCVLRLDVLRDEEKAPRIVGSGVMLRAEPGRALAELATNPPWPADSLLGAAIQFLAKDPNAAPFRFVRRLDLTYGARYVEDRWAVLGGSQEYQLSSFTLLVDLEIDLENEIASQRRHAYAQSHLDPPVSSDGSSMLMAPGWKSRDTLEGIGVAYGRSESWPGEPSTVTRNMQQYDTRR